VSLSRCRDSKHVGKSVRSPERESPAMSTAHPSPEPPGSWRLSWDELAKRTGTTLDWSVSLSWGSARQPIRKNRFARATSTACERWQRSRALVYGQSRSPGQSQSASCRLATSSTSCNVKRAARRDTAIAAGAPSMPCWNNGGRRLATAARSFRRKPTWNPLTGCSKGSPAAAAAGRFLAPMRPIETATFGRRLPCPW
jgi:hypothetical protein